MLALLGGEKANTDSSGSDPDTALAEPAEDEYKERHCDSLIMCIVTTLNEGLRNGGGIGDVLRKPSNNVSTAINT